MPQTDETNDATGRSGPARFSMSKVVLTIAGLVVGATAILLTLAPDVPPKGTLTLGDAYVHGAVTHVGIAHSARIAALRVDLGDKVTARDVVATLDADALRARVRGAEADVTRLRAELARAEIADSVAEGRLAGARAQSEAAIRAADARVASALAARDSAQDALERNSELARRGIIAKARLEEFERAAEEATALVARRRAELTEAQAATVALDARAERSGLRAAERAVLRARLAEAQADLSRLQSGLADTDVAAKVSGVVVDVAARAGASVRPNDTIVSIWNTDRIWMRAWVAEDQVARISSGDRATIEIDALAGRSVQGTVQRILVSRNGQEQLLPGQPISPLLPDESRFAVQVAFDPGTGLRDALLPGMSGTVRIALTEGADTQQGPTEKILSYGRGLLQMLTSRKG
ncbi:HlyD family efflux transporter periplasmic adaptor subunit [Maribius pontilimi]|uniref:HlyD family efflux transporter periplasmic adaptor subunit n=1 Tax=Palleronia pontilimi TaxID=1964209 RepID=A0A934MCZ8_9RHOB|nr:efflux RND transporter periplasmic adaptor subunit [Palleronia pontilimi]MBJ3763338.1 HlyD family efflux transporter periplasmic adaptor subunit [Palleronia pontilimi]